MKITIVDKQTPQVSAYDRAFQFGDGHFTTMLIENGQIALWPSHLLRLKRAHQRLGFPAIDWHRLDEQVQQYVSQIQYHLQEHANQKKNVLKMVISRGNSQRGYAADPNAACHIYIYHSAYPTDLITQLHKDLALGEVKFQLGLQPRLAGIKHCNRLEQVQIKQELVQSGQLDGLVFDINNKLIETSVANIFLYKEGQWFTPDLAQSGVDGVMRQHIKTRCEQLNINLTICQIAKDKLESYQAGFICNALIGIVPIKQLLGQSLTIKPVTDLTSQLGL